ncbi:MAG: glutamate mutase L [Thermomicrobiales bacterium]
MVATRANTSSSAASGAQEIAPESLLVADFGRGTSRAFLLEQVAGAIRLVARAEGPTTFDLPFDDVSVGWLQTLRQIEWDAGRVLIERDNVLTPQRQRGDGVDAMLACSSLGEPIRIAVIDTGPSPMLAPAITALRKTHVSILQASVPATKKDTTWVPTWAEAIRAYHPDTVVLLLDGEQTFAVPRAIQLLKGISGSISPRRGVIFGEATVLGQTLTLFGSRSKVRSITPSGKTGEAFGAELEAEARGDWAERIDRTDLRAALREVTGTVPTRAHAVDLVTRYIARVSGQSVLTFGIDDGSHAHWASGQEAAQTAFPRLDINAGIVNLTAREVADAVNWLPFDIETDDLMTWVLNRAIRPWAAPEAEADIRIEQALLRQVIRRVAADLDRTRPGALESADLLIAGAGIDRWHDAAIAALCLLDGLYHVPASGIVGLAIDSDGLLPVVGTLGMTYPAVASDIFQHDTLQHLGSAIVLTSLPKPGEPACRVELQVHGGQKREVTVKAGSLVTLPLASVERATIVVRPEKKVSIGASAAGKPVTFGGERPIAGGAAGIIIDARGRQPLPSPAVPRTGLVRQWIEAVRGAAGTTGAERTERA